MGGSLSERIGAYLEYAEKQRRYSPRTVDLYSATLKRFSGFAEEDSLDWLSPSVIRSYEVYLMDTCRLDARTVNLHLSVLSGFCRYLVKRGDLKSNPVGLVAHPKAARRLPVFFREETMERYFRDSAWYASAEAVELLRQTPDARLYSSILSRMIISLLYATGLRRSELISLKMSSFDRSRRTLSVLGKGDRMRSVPLTDSVFAELTLYLEACSCFFGDWGDSLFRTPSGRMLYPVFVDRTIKNEMSSVSGTTGRKSPHVLRHTIATGLLDGGADMNSIKEFLGHSSLAATQVYTHASIERLQAVYRQAHPRSKGKD